MKLKKIIRLLQGPLLYIIATVLALHSGCAFGDQDALDALYNSGDPLYVVVGYNGEIFISKDGRSWTYETDFTGNVTKNITYGNGIFIVGGDGIWTSSDRISWTNRTLTPIAYGIVISSGFYLIATDWGNIYHTTDMITLTQVYDDSGSLYGLYYGGGMFIAVGNNNIGYSSDGMTWQTASGPADGLTDVCYGQGIYVAVGETAGSPAIHTSPNGAIWSGNVAPAVAGIATAITYGNRRFVTVGDPVYMFISENGTNWNCVTTPVSTLLYDITYSYPYFIAVGANETILISEDGYSWEVVHNTPGGTTFQGVTVRP